MQLVSSIHYKQWTRFFVVEWVEFDLAERESWVSREAEVVPRSSIDRYH